MEEPWQAYTVRAVPLGKCTDDNHFGMMRFSTAWDRDATQTLIGTKNMTNALTARLQSTRPKDGVYYRNPEMQVYLKIIDPSLSSPYFTNYSPGFCTIGWPLYWIQSSPSTRQVFESLTVLLTTYQLSLPCARKRASGNNIFG